MNPTNFLTELKRRNVYRAAVAYGVVAWFLTQLTTQVFPFFEIPNSAVRFVVIALAIGFPIAMLLSWLYELTPEGIVRTEDLDPAEARSVQRATGRILDFIIIGVLLLVIAMLIVGRRPFYTQTGESISQKSIAVLPFENRSEDKANAYFADGIQDEILTLLSKIADLKVISRTSTQQYQSKPRNLTEIAKQLGVANILEGSVQKVADQVRVNVQLLNAQTDSHLWAETYDRKLTDIFAVESEIAKGIAESLQAKLTGREEQALAVKPTNNPEAYDAYLRGLAFEARSEFDALGKAISSYEQAVELDPNFALGWARLSRGHALLYFREAGDITAARRDAAKSALDTAQKLQPNSPETLLALGYYQYWVLRDYGLAKTTFKHVQKILPGSSDAVVGLGAVSRREGHWDQSVAYWEQALALDPRNVELLVQAASTHAELRQFQAALKLYDRALDIVPNEPNLMASKAGIYQAEGNLEQAAKFLSQIDAQTPSPIALGIKMTQLRLERNYAEVIRLLQARQARPPSASETIKAITQVELALHQRVASDTAGAKVAAEQARNTLEQLCKNQPDNPDFAALLSLAYAALGEKDSALKEAERAIALLPSAKDRVYGPGLEENLAVIQTMFGANSQAILTLARLLQMPYYGGFYFETPVTPALLRLDPLWDPLRGDPRFEKLVEEAKQPTALEPVEKSAPEKSIAVLPFENLSKDEENAYFAGGVQDEILTNLAKVADLKVISRTSVMKYKSDLERNLREIAKALGVSHVIEGSVQRAGGRVRVNAQLIDTRTDTHIWAEHYDRDVADVFAIQTEIAQQITNQLQAKLSATEKAAIAERPTADPVAYAFYTQANAIGDVDDWGGWDKSLNQKVELLEKATQRDPNFALAYCALAKTQCDLDNGDPKQLELAKKAADAALRVRPDLGEAHLELARYYYYANLHTGDFDRARDEVTITLRKLPNNSEALVIGARIDKRQNRWDASLANLQKASELDPRNIEVAYYRRRTLLEMRRYKELEQLFAKDAASGILHGPWTQLGLAELKLAQGEPVAAQALLAQVPLEFSPYEWIWRVRFTTTLYLRDYDAANRVVAATSAKFAFVHEPGQPPESWANGEVARARGDKQKALAVFAAARKRVDAAWENKVKDESYFEQIAILDAGLGKKEEAIREARRAVDLMPIAKDSYWGPLNVADSALVYAWTGERDRALEQLEIVAKIPNGPTYGDLKFNPCWDSLRGDKRFDKIVAAAKAASR